MQNINKRFIPVIVIILIAIVYGVYYIFQSSLQGNGLVVSGTIEATEIHLGVVSSGIVEEIFVEEGDTVRDRRHLLTTTFKRKRET